MYTKEDAKRIIGWKQLNTQIQGQPDAVNGNREGSDRAHVKRRLTLANEENGLALELAHAAALLQATLHWK